MCFTTSLRDPVSQVMDPLMYFDKQVQKQQMPSCKPALAWRKVLLSATGLLRSVRFGIIPLSSLQESIFQQGKYFFMCHDVSSGK